MEPELSDIFWVKVVAKNIVLGSPRTHYMHTRVKQLNNKARLVNCIFQFEFLVKASS